MKLYLLTRTDKWSYDDYDSFVVAAENEINALEWCPNGEHRESNDFKKWGCGEWTSKENIKVEHIGESNSLVEKVIISSFNAA